MAITPTPPRGDDVDDDELDDDDDARRRRRSSASAKTTTTSMSMSMSTQRRRDADGAWKDHICGVKVRFPIATPYASQKHVMMNVIRACKRGRSALIESPTGSGKSLALLCSTLAFAEWAYDNEGGDDGDDGGVNGGVRGDNDSGGGDDPGRGDDGGRDGDGGVKKDAKRRAPRIYYATRTHSQIEQVVRELARTSYRPQTVVLASRDNYCVNAKVKRTGNVNEECRKLMDDSQNGRGCYCAGAAASKLAAHAKTSTEPLDIEDLVKMGKRLKGCPYFASKIMAEDAELVFTPYNYILDPRTRAAMDIDIEGSIIIFDEGHNIEDTSREAASEDVMLDDIAEAVISLELMRDRATAHREDFETLYNAMHGIYSWFLRVCDADGGEYALKQHEQLFETWGATLRGEQSLTPLESSGLTQERVSDVMRALSAASKYNQELKDSKERISGAALNTCEKVLNPLRLLLSQGATTARDYRIVIGKTLSETEKTLSTQAQHSSLPRLPMDEVVQIQFRCLNPALAFRELVGEKGARSIILTSGTLAPLNSFASELGVDFPIRMEAQHCVDMDKQVWGSVVASGPSNRALNAGFKSRSDWAFQDELGASLKEWAKVVPHGMLMFFPSFSLMEAVVQRWRDSGVLNAIESASGKKVFQEPPSRSSKYGTSKKVDTLEQVLEKYYKRVSDSVKAAPHPYAPAPQTARSGRGAILLAVCRGKISEGIDFADANARAVICVGIPYPNYKDPLVQAKRSYNDSGRHRGLLPGQKWYDQQAFRALNQAVGRCLRHRYDHGAIMLVDERFGQNATQSLPKWLQGAMQKPNVSFEQQLASLSTFFDAHAENPPKDHEPAAKRAHEEEDSSRRKRRSIGSMNSPNKAKRNTPITAFFAKAVSKNTYETSDADYAAQPSTSEKPSESFARAESLAQTVTAKVCQEPVYQEPVFDAFDDEFDWDALEMPPPAPERAESPEKDQAVSIRENVNQILDSIEWDDEDDADEWFNMVETTQKAEASFSQMHTKTESNGVLDTALVVTSPVIERVCATCGRKPLGTLSIANDANIERVTLKSSYLDEFGGATNFIVVPELTQQGVCCGQESTEATFDASSGMAFRPLFSCAHGGVIGFKVEATNVAHQRLAERVLLRE